jgi:hypothetical protein
MLNGTSASQIQTVLNTFDPKKCFHVSKYREPRRQFWTKSQLEEIEPARYTNLSNEVMHWTVRSFSKHKIYLMPEPLRSAEVNKINGKTGVKCDCHTHRHDHQWRILFNDLNTSHYHVCEDNRLDEQDYPDNELNMVVTWLEAELDHLQVTAKGDHGSPDTFITELLVEIRNFLQEKAKDSGLSAGQSSKL